MKGLIVAVAALVMGPAAMAGAQTTAPPISAESNEELRPISRISARTAPCGRAGRQPRGGRAWAAPDPAVRSPRR